MIDVAPQVNSLVEAAGEASDVRAESFSRLIERARGGDAGAFEQLMIISQEKVVSVAWRALGNEEDARDAAQETFLRVFKHLKHYRPEQDYFGWLYRIAINVCRDIARQRRRHARFAAPEGEREPVALDNVPGPGDAEEAAIYAQRRRIVMDAMASLPERERHVIVLRDFEGLSTQEVAQVTGARPSTVRAQLSSARAKIKAGCDRLLKRKRQE